MVQKRLGAGAGLHFLVLVIKIRRDRVVGVVDLDDEVGDRQLQAVGVEAERLVRRREAELRAEISEDVRHMRDDDLAVAQERGREGRERLVPHQRHHRVDAASGPSLTRDVDVVGAGLLEGEADEFAAARDSGQ